MPAERWNITVVGLVESSLPTIHTTKPSPPQYGYRNKIAPHFEEPPKTKARGFNQPKPVTITIRRSSRLHQNPGTSSGTGRSRTPPVDQFGCCSKVETDSNKLRFTCDCGLGSDSVGNWSNVSGFQGVKRSRLTTPISRPATW